MFKHYKPNSNIRMKMRMKMRMMMTVVVAMWCIFVVFAQGPGSTGSSSPLPELLKDRPERPALINSALSNCT